MKRLRAAVVAIVAAAGIGVAVLSAAAFAPADQRAMPDPAVSAIPTVTDWHQIELPLDSYHQDVTNRQLVLKAEYETTKNCMQRFGFDFDAPKWDKANLPDEQTAHYRLYGLLDEEHARQMGYHAYGKERTAEAIYSEEQHSPDYYNVIAAKMGGGAYEGEPIPQGGCIGEARHTIEGSTTGSEDLLAAIGYKAWSNSNRDSRVKAGFAAWSQCMSRSGFSYNTPMDANNDPTWSGERVSEAEVSVAVADVKCKKQTNLVGIRMAINSAFQRSGIAVHAAELQAVKDGLGQQVAKAKEILSEEVSRHR